MIMISGLCRTSSDNTYCARTATLWKLLLRRDSLVSFWRTVGYGCCWTILFGPATFHLFCAKVPCHDLSPGGSQYAARDRKEEILGAQIYASWPLQDGPWDLRLPVSHCMDNTSQKHPNFNSFMASPCPSKEAWHLKKMVFVLRPSC